MNSTTQAIPKRSAMILPAATVCLCGGLAIPPLIAASGNDLYAKGATLAFFIWLIPQVFYFSAKFNKSKPHCHFWIAIALVICVLGSISELRVLYYVSFAASIIGFFGLRYLGLLAFVAAASWIPSTGWFISSVKTGGLLGWERPLFAGLMSFAIFAIIHSKTKTPLSTLTNS